jgi:hypothetical protein
MVLWFAGGSWLLVWATFQDPAIDYRLVMAGALAPDAVDGVAGGARVLHTLAFSVGLLLVVMLGTRGRRATRRRLLALPIGTFLHLVLDGMWTHTHVFWWPAFGAGFGGAPLPSIAHPVALTLLEEAAGLSAVAWCVWRFGLRHPERRARFLRTGRLGPEFGAAGRRARR